VQASRKYIELISHKDKLAGRALSMLLYGQPGTGKSEFVHHLGKELGKDVLLRKCSEIQSMWVGETEKNIALAFREAQENNSILFFDEADSFLYPRNSAVRSWEKNFTNEILAQLDSFTGIVIFATNDMAGLDHASLRRFKFKVEFMPLNSEGNLEMYKTLLCPLVKDETLSNRHEMSIRALTNLTPGDFAVVRDQFEFTEMEGLKHEQLIAALINEVRYKHKPRPAIGFSSSAA
jgi:SpoVK/Ycf46/Vps4 family AAA+-type ATPase